MGFLFMYNSLAFQEASATVLSLWHEKNYQTNILSSQFNTNMTMHFVKFCPFRYQIQSVHVGWFRSLLSQRGLNSSSNFWTPFNSRNAYDMLLHTSRITASSSVINLTNALWNTFLNQLIKYCSEVIFGGLKLHCEYWNRKHGDGLLLLRQSEVKRDA